MRHLVLVTLAGGLLLSSVGCNKSHEPTTPMSAIKKPIAEGMKSNDNNGAGKAGKNPVKID